eukprot:TRINITY_DN8574_c0_g1_i3.p1 TRINITY_DN8574_c0_g1~~TRINITY_DN8574_c0_g1_i3.p1  ORF type:complete len:131 (-),score=18.02 TRINITY_DN8574_c0_g1_i3:316-663(-)
MCIRDRELTCQMAKHQHTKQLTTPTVLLPNLPESIDLSSLIPPPNPLASTNTQSATDLNAGPAPTQLVLKCVPPSVPCLPAKPTCTQPIPLTKSNEKNLETMLVARYPILRDEEL